MSKRICVNCGAGFYAPKISKGRSSKRRTCSDACHRAYLVKTKKPWSEEEDAYIHDHANEFPLPLFLKFYNRFAVENGFPMRSRTAFSQRVNRLGYKLEPLTFMIGTKRLAELLKIPRGTVDDWPRQGLKVSCRLKDGTRYYNLKEVRNFAIARPQNFGGLKYEDLYRVLGDVDLCREIVLKYPRRHTGIAKPRRVLCVTTNKIYGSLAEAGKANFLSRTVIYKSCKFGKQYAGLRFQYFD